MSCKLYFIKDYVKPENKFRFNWTDGVVIPFGYAARRRWTQHTEVVTYTMNGPYTSKTFWNGEEL